MSISSLINANGESCITSRATDTVDEIGVSVSYWALLGSGTIWLQPASTSLITEYAKRNISITNRGYSATNLNIKEGDRITINDIHYLVRGIKDNAGLGQLFDYRLEQVL